MSKKQRYFYYYDEVHDDFASNSIVAKPIPEDYEYFPKSRLYRIIEPVAYYFIAVIIKICYGLRLVFPIKNKKVLKERRDRKKGYFVFANHTNAINDAFAHPGTAFPGHCYHIVHPDGISIKGLSTFLRMIGLFPRPEKRKTYLTFYNSIEKAIGKGRSIVIFPEAHIWPKYNKIRNFPDVSFYYPVKLDAPCYARTTVYKKRRDGSTKGVTYYDGPFYADQKLPFKEAQKDLRDRIHKKMTERANDSAIDCNYHYIKVETPDEVRMEVV
ncbi:MAG: 1-acyl-sn-glycerol-3-phosphate acyltransferase [Bacteroidales bacterium]|nr:1-acyl-sn-glycerol-3-phosphate acyltransferase [Bacteroidales bacterium]